MKPALCSLPARWVDPAENARSAAPLSFTARHDLADKVEKWFVSRERRMRRNRVISIPPISIARDPANVIGALHELGYLKKP